MKTKLRGATAIVAVLLGAACSGPSTDPAPPAATDITVFEGARVIVGDGSAPIENAVFVVDDAR